MARFTFFPHCVLGRGLFVILLAGFGTGAFSAEAPVFSKGDTVELSRSEPLLFNGKIILDAAKHQEFSVLKHDALKHVVYVAYLKEDNTLIAVTVAEESLRPLLGEPAKDLLQGAEAFREFRFEDAKRLVSGAGADPKFRAVAVALAGRINTAALTARQAQAKLLPTSGQAFSSALQALRESAEQLAGLGALSAALPIEEGIERLAAQSQAAAPVSKLNREELTRRVSAANRSVFRARQTVALRRLMEASKSVEEGLAAEPGRVELKRMDAKIQRSLADAEDDFKAADSFRKKTGGMVHALSALQDGLKRCGDHPRLLALRKELTGAYEERTAPPVNPAFLSALGANVAAKGLEEGHRLYTSRCTECHELEMLDSRSVSGWIKAVADMARRANLDQKAQSQVVAYIAAAQTVVEKTGK